MCNKIKMVVQNMKIKKMKMVNYVYFKAEFQNHTPTKA